MSVVSIMRNVKVGDAFSLTGSDTEQALISRIKTRQTDLIKRFNCIKTMVQITNETEIINDYASVFM
ncbi:hypothetical protein GCM10009128_27270 [Psychrosphaera haliotis]